MARRGEIKRAEILAYITAYLEEFGVSPTLGEIAEGVGLASASSARSHILAMQAAGQLVRLDGKVRTIKPVEV